jgi:AcrR family transcriptional regulator
MGKSDQTRKKIILSAEYLLLEKGLTPVSMEDIALKAGCHRRTLYRYFPVREDLIYDVVTHMMEEMNSFQRELAGSLEGSGLTRFRLFLEGLAAYMKEHLPRVRFMGEFDFTYGESHPYLPSPEREKRFLEAAHVTEGLLNRIIAFGQEDGSITLDCSPAVFVPTVTTMLLGAAQRIALRGELIDREFGISRFDMVACQIQIYLKAVSRKGAME